MRLRELAELFHLTDTQIATESGVSRSTISRVRRELVIPDRDTVDMLDAWSEAFCDHHRLESHFRLTWEHLIGDAA